VRGLAELGYVYGEHAVTEPRGSEGKPERFADLKAARALGLTIPRSLRLRADHVSE
jgi:hypothetical protein